MSTLKQGTLASRRCGALLMALAAAPVIAAADPDPLDLGRRIAALENEIRQTRTKLRDLESTAAESRERGRQLTAEVREIEASIEHKRDELRRTERRYRDRRRAKAEERQALAAQIRAHYLSGRAPHLKLLLSQDDPAVLGRALAYTSYLQRTRVAAIDRAGAELAELAELAGRMERELDEFGRLENRYRSALVKLEQDRQTARISIRQARSHLQQRRSKLDALIADAARLENLFRDLPAPEPQPGNGAFADRRGRLSWPLSGELLAGFGSARRVGDLKWRGALIGAEPGVPVQAVAGGRVAFAGPFRNWGYLVILEHGAGYMSLYGFAEAGGREVGEWVDEGETVATTGQIPGQKSAGVYFEVRHDGEPQNPARWCLGMPGRQQAAALD